jgi:hypothetical protein
MALINNYEEASYFAAHPVKAFDPFYTRDFDSFDATWHDFKKWAARRVTSLIDEYELDCTSSRERFLVRQKIAEIYGMYDSINRKCHAYGIHTGNFLLHR